jgi:hypothetical protein
VSRGGNHRSLILCRLVILSAENTASQLVACLSTVIECAAVMAAPQRFETEFCGVLTFRIYIMRTLDP